MEGGQYGENLHNLLLDDKKVTERDKVCIINIEIRGIYFNRNPEDKTKIDCVYYSFRLPEYTDAQPCGMKMPKK